MITENAHLPNVGCAVNYLLSERVRRGIDHDELDMKSGVSWRSVYYWRHVRDPQILNFVAVAETLGCEVILRRRKISC
ncbi:MAG: hypothetical protein JSC189_000701 [Candidatus Tokpelaia sp. JSC189]|nr:MAG: hypothetical protein JSC189_000701 [Candidatus Tokpelaia sp. JSC189]